MRSADYTEDQLCTLALAATEGVGPVAINRLAEYGRTRGLPMRKVLDILADDRSCTVDLPGGSTRRIAGMRRPLDEADRLLQLLDKANAQPVFRDDPVYPQKLTEFLDESAPPVLFLAGQRSLLKRPTVAIVGSRQPSSETRRAAYHFASQLAADGTLIVSGGARGIDTAAHQGALAPGCTAVVPPTGIMRFRWKGPARVHANRNRWMIVGQFPPQDPWRTRNALQRNHTIVALSDAVVGFEPRDHGGTWRSCRSALRMRKPLFVVNARSHGPYQRGQEAFVNSGAIALDPARMPDPEEFKALVQSYSPPSIDVQMPLFQDPTSFDYS